MATILKNTLRDGLVSRVVSHYLPALLVSFIVIISIGYADRQNIYQAETQRRIETTKALTTIREKLDSSIQNNIYRLQGLVAALEIEPQMDQEKFSQLASRMMRGDTELRNIAAAPDLVVKLVHPIRGNEKSIGLNYLTNERQRASVLLAKTTGRLIITGPVDLVQGGRGLIARFPIFSVGTSKETRFWGILSGVIDIDRLYQSAGLNDPNQKLNIAIHLDNGVEEGSKAFFGEDSTFEDNPVEMTINFGDESWHIAAVPKSGWNSIPEGVLLFRAIILLAGLMVIVPMIWAGRLMEEREEHIDALQEREDRLHALSHRLEMALQTSRIGVWEFHANNGKLIWDSRMRDLYDIDPAQENCTYEDWNRALHPDDLVAAEEVFAHTLSAGGGYSSEFRIRTRSGEVRHVRAIGDTFIDGNGDKMLVGVNWNVTADVRMRDELQSAKMRAEEQNRELELARGQMEYNALHDTLTQLPNRRFLDQTLMIKREDTGSLSRISILHVDLDRFKEINDTLGHAAGDEMLRHAAKTLRSCISSDDFVARIGGDEFVVVSPSTGNPDKPAELAARIIEAMSGPVIYEGAECRTGVSIGIACQSDRDNDFQQVLINADIALYEAKRRGRNRFEFFTEALRSAVINSKQTADEILRGLENDEFLAFYQPQFDAHTLEIVGVEALVRWNHPQKGLLAPVSFLPTAESLNVVGQIDQLVLEQALLQFHRWQAARLDIPKVSVNISAQRLKDEKLFERLDKLAIQPGSVCFELLESISFDENDQLLIDNISRIKELGIDIEIDDFGTGYASIVSLLKLSPRRLKIDRQLVMPLLHSPAQQQLVSSIIDIGLSRGMEIIAEGVETPAHAEILRDLGCHALQGYAFARPMSGNDFIRFARQRAWFGILDTYARPSGNQAS